jgi:hypothetical protein
MVGAALLFCTLVYENVCQLEGSDHGGRDSAAELALAGVECFVSGGSDFEASPIRGAALYTSERVSQWLYAMATSSAGFRIGIKGMARALGGEFGVHRYAVSKNYLS